MSRQASPERRLRSLRVPAPPPALRARTLAVARHAARVRPPGRWSALYHSRALRIAWAATIVALVLAHVVLSIERMPGDAAVHVMASPGIDGEPWVSLTPRSPARSVDLRSIEDDIALWASRRRAIPEEKLR